MCRCLHRLTALLSLCALCSCSTLSLPTTDVRAPNGAEAIQATQSPPVPISTETVTNGTNTAQPFPEPDLSPVTASLQCTNYVETRWGTGAEEFGLCPTSSDAWIRGPYPPKLDARGDLFVVDKANQRILKYSGDSIPQVIPIPSSYVLDDVCGYANRWPNVSVSKDRLFFLFSVRQDDRVVDRLAVLSVKGHAERIINLEPYYPLHSPYMDSLVSDRRGGVYLLLPPAGIVHFDAELRPEFKYLGSDDSSIYENLVVGWDSNLYMYSTARDDLTNWGKDNRLFMLDESLTRIENVIAATQIVSPTHTRLLGADNQGQLYFRTRGQGGNGWVVRVSASGDERVIAAVPAEDPLPSSLAPNGSLYSFAYDLTDPSIRPRIVRCVLDQG